MEESKKLEFTETWVLAYKSLSTKSVGRPKRWDIPGSTVLSPSWCRPSPWLMASRRQSRPST
ncbi:hypothetical protein BJV74DRAFT_618234 [Russula compacta]|nr:hypothetical protein BJV74DRAFT_618234 [Russula compacta]